MLLTLLCSHCTYKLLGTFPLVLSQMAPMLVQNALEVPEYEINPNELDFSKSVNITKVSCCLLLAFTLNYQISLIHIFKISAFFFFFFFVY